MKLGTDALEDGVFWNAGVNALGKDPDATDAKGDYTEGLNAFNRFFTTQNPDIIQMFTAKTAYTDVDQIVARYDAIKSSGSMLGNTFSDCGSSAGRRHKRHIFLPHGHRLGRGESVRAHAHASESSLQGRSRSVFHRNGFPHPGGSALSLGSQGAQPETHRTMAPRSEQPGLPVLDALCHRGPGVAFFFTYNLLTETCLTRTAC